MIKGKMQIALAVGNAPGEFTADVIQSEMECRMAYDDVVAVLDDMVLRGRLTADQRDFYNKVYRRVI